MPGSACWYGRLAVGRELKVQMAFRAAFMSKEWYP